MEQHPVPQNITGYQFRLVGDMTLKQFGFLAGGGIIAILFYYSPFPPFFKYPFVVLFALAGIALAFFPINDMPLDRWVIAFFKSIYSPTQFHWRKEDRIPEFLQYQPIKAKIVSTPQPVPETDKLSEFLGTIVSQESSAMDKLEQNLLQHLTQTIKDTGAVIPAITTTPARPAPARPLAETTAPNPKPPIPINKPIPETAKPIPRGPTAIPTQITPQSTEKGPTPAVSAKFATSVPFPHVPETPNSIVGMVFTRDGKIVENAIIEVRDSEGHPVRALKTNKIGQFFIGQPLKNGSYEMEIEKEGMSFDIIKFEARGAIMPPIEIRATI